jgi:hypothetical protein
MSQWTLFSNHGHVLLFLAREPQSRLRDVAQSVGITERAVQKIVRDLQDGGIISVSKHGRRNRYRVHTRKSLRHPLESHRTVGSLVNLMKDDARTPTRKVVPVVEVAIPTVQEEDAVEARYPHDELPPQALPDPEPVPVFDEEPPFDMDDEWQSGPDPELEPEPEPVLEPVPDWEPEPLQESRPEPEPEPEPEPKLEPEPEPDPEPEPEPDPPKEQATAKKRSRKKPVDEQQGSLF